MAAGYPASSVPSTRVELHVSCDNLRDADVFSKSDPIASVRINDGCGGWKEVSLVLQPLVFI